MSLSWYPTQYFKLFDGWKTEKCHKVNNKHLSLFQVLINWKPWAMNDWLLTNLKKKINKRLNVDCWLIHIRKCFQSSNVSICLLLKYLISYARLGIEQNFQMKLDKLNVMNDFEMGLTQSVILSPSFHFKTVQLNIKHVTHFHIRF